MTTLRWCVPWVHGRGAGLGNELVPWSRAWLMASVIGARCLPPAFGFNTRPYHRHFGTPRTDWLLHRLARATLPTVHFGEAEYNAHGAGDVRTSFASFAASHGLSSRGPLWVTTDGLWGGLDHIAAAREFVRGRLYTARHAAANLAALGQRLDPDKLTVAMHVRLGDFASPAPQATAEHYRNRFNCALPLDWFIDAGVALRRAFGSQVQFQVFSDGTPAQLQPLSTALQPVDTRSPHAADISDLLAMASGDLLLCSVSSYSAWAAFLSPHRYAWFAPQMEPIAPGWAAIWGHDADQRQADSPTLRALAARQAEPPGRPGRGIAWAPGEPAPDELLADLTDRLARRRRAADPVRYGVAAIGDSHAQSTMPDSI